MIRSSTETHPCLLCEGRAATRFFTDLKPAFRGATAPWPYYHCADCDLIFRDPGTFLDLNQEAEHYRNHENQVGDAGYLKFLAPVIEAVRQKRNPGARGLDYGCGPGPALAVELEQQGYEMRVWDPVFHSDPNALNETFDFVTCTEVVEHFRQPAKEFQELLASVKDGGELVLRTEFHAGQERFSSWAYRIDPTHVCFYSQDTISWLSRKFGWDVEFPNRNVAVLSRRSKL